MYSDLIYVIHKEDHDEVSLKTILGEHPEIKFVSFVGIDLAGNDTDEKIPISLFLEDFKSFQQGSVQTDGSSVVLPGIASLNNAKVDLVPDFDVKWFVDYNFEHIDEETNKPIGSLRIPCFLRHDDKFVDSRHILQRSITHVKEDIMNTFKTNPSLLIPYGIVIDDIDEIICTSATELEFWVKTPEHNAHVEELSTSQVLHEQYWTRTKGVVRTALEQTVLLMEKYELEPEMGHKEVGGVKAQLSPDGSLTHIMEQLEIDWKYADAMQTAENELFTRILVRETFRRNGLDVTFLAKPMPGVAGSGKHVHVSITLKTKSGKMINIFAPTEKDYLSTLGYASVMGILKNYEIINPFVSATNDAFRRLQPGFEAPVCIVTSVGNTVDIPSRNRTVLLGVIRDFENPLGTRFELRSPNPISNTYLVLAATYMALSDGIDYAVEYNKTSEDLLKELSKTAGETTDYLEKDREYRSEKDVFEDYDDETRERLFGRAPRTVYENLAGFDNNPHKVSVLTIDNVFTSAIINSFCLGVISRWETEISKRVITNYFADIRSYKMLHQPEKACDIDLSRWTEINNLRLSIAKDTLTNKCLFTKIKEAINSGDYQTLSNLQIELDKIMKHLAGLYQQYSNNLLDI